MLFSNVPMVSTRFNSNSTAPILPSISTSLVGKLQRQSLLPSLLSRLPLEHTHGPGAERNHVAQDMAALCSLAFMRRAAILEDLRSGSMFMSYELMPVAMAAEEDPKRLPM